MRADVPLAFCLSGGVDSSSMVSIASKILNKDVTTFSIIDSDERYNELENIDRTIQDTGCKNEKVYLSNVGIRSSKNLKDPQGRRGYYCKCSARQP